MSVNIKLILLTATSPHWNRSENVPTLSVFICNWFFYVIEQSQLFRKDKHAKISVAFPTHHTWQSNCINPLTPVPAVTGHEKTHPQFPMPAVTGREKACEDNCLSYPPWRDFDPPIVLLLLRTNKPMRMDFLSVLLGDFRGPRKTVFCLQITRSKSASNHGALRAKSTNFQSLVFIP